MSVIVTDRGFSPDTHNGEWFDLASDADIAAVERQIEGVSAIRVAFPAFSDGRGFTLAARLRRAGFTGRLRAAGHVIADQYAMARRSGFDEVEISDDLAARQPQEQWLSRADWQGNDYRARLRRIA
ncbi:DUF934 domain-containing protein [Pararhodobacter sp. CCB-MM2]|uniref:DUF934 domain-containing protein n=1 Tax=Pararhodobacter sp. CCB-MM2 TaxID=1786003 RepID=UPI0008348893|nr:DUF934 domain-containing protein [Pararhodobacter sp. CCB-MM2]MCA2013206.1 DUF934 domain-containing protein [Cereibacter sphaeroides]